MKKTIMAVVGILVASLLTMHAAESSSLKAHPKSKAWADLFSVDLSNAVFPAGVWVWKDGELSPKDKDEVIWSKKDYENFILDLEFKTDKGTNSGVVVHCSDMKDWIPNSVEIQIADDFDPKWGKSPKTWQCAAIFGRMPPTKSAVKKPGQWNRMTVTCKGKMIYVMLNGELVTECDMSQWTSATKNPDGSDIPAWLSKPMAGLQLKGHIGLQGKHAGAPIYFRNLKIKRID